MNIENTKLRLKSVHGLRSVWSRYRNWQLANKYLSWRENYAKIADEKGLVYSGDSVKSQVRQRLRDRGYAAKCRRLGEVHTFACIAMYGWHKHLLPDLMELGPVSHFDMVGMGFDYLEISRGTSKGIVQRSEMNQRILPTLREANAKCPVDWVLFYGGGQEVSPAVLQAITEEMGIPIVNMSFDDKQGWAGRWMGDCRAGAIDITPWCDLFMTSARVVCEWHLIEGGRPIYLPPGFNSKAFRPLYIKYDIPVSFVGTDYGARRPMVEYLKRHNVPVSTYGLGWNSGWLEDNVELYNRSQINLGHGGIEYSSSLTNVKGRDIEVPGTGGGVYLTSFNPDLAEHYDIGKEIVCYRSYEELVELVRYYLRRADESRQIAQRGRERCMREHRWLHRYQTLLRTLNVLE